MIAKPDVDVSTKYVYDNLQVETIAHHPDIKAVEAAVRAGDRSGMCEHMENILETVTERRYPVISELKASLKNSGAQAALMSGSGPSVFGIFPTTEQAAAACDALRKEGKAKHLHIAAFTDRGCREKRL